jgi:hypothetical protein
MMQRMYGGFPHGTLASSLIVLAIVVAICVSLAASISILVLLRGLRRHREQLSDHQRQIQNLTSRVWNLEQGWQSPVASIASSAEKSAPPVTSEPAPAAAFSAPADWEAQFGANWLNRIGALILVIGFALLLAFSWTRLGPAGKVAIGLGSGAVLLFGGISLSRRPLYRNYSVSLIAGGWALLYFTCYATYAVPPAQLFRNPGVPFAAMMAVSAGMVVHALRYQSEAATALAFVFGFVTLHVPAPDLFTIVAAAVLALGTLGLSYRFHWRRLPVAGAALTYLTVALRYGDGGAIRSLVTPALWVYWCCFELFDLLRPSRRWATSPLFAINVTGFVGAWMLLSGSRPASEVALFFAAAGLSYLASAFARARIEPVVEARTPAPYEVAAICSATLTAAALVQQFGGSRVALALGLEGELVILAAWSLQRLWLRRAGEVLLAIAIGRLLLFDAFEAGPWTAVGIALTAALIANRAMLANSWPHAVGAVVLLLRISYAELPDENVIAGLWAVAAIVLMVAGQRLQFGDVRWLAVPVIVAAFIQCLSITAAGGAVWPSAVTAACLYAMQFAWRARSAVFVQTSASALATLLIATVLAEKVEGGMLTVAFGVQAGVLLAAGFATTSRTLRLSGLCVFVAAIIKLFLYDLRELDAIGRTFAFLALGVLLLAASWVYTKRKSA